MISEEEIQISKAWILQNRIARNKRWDQEKLDWQRVNR